MTGGGHTDGGAERRERVLVATPIAAIGRGSGGPLLVTLLVIAAFAAGLLRPWDLLGPSPGATSSVQPAAPTAAAVLPTSRSTAEAAVTAPPTPRAGTALSLCGYPGTWRTMSRVWWSGHPATVWAGAEVVEARGPDDPTIPWTPVGPAPVTAIGWCAAVGDAERPPKDAAASLFRVDNGVASVILRPAGASDASDPMGQLWFTPGVNPQPWPAGQYVIRFATPSGSWVRYLGLSVEGLDDSPLPTGSPTPLG